jgi:urease accessory protein
VSGLIGHLDLIAAPDAAGRTILRKQSFSPPIHISKPHHDAGWLVVNLASPSPGLLAGDRINATVSVETGARLLLTAPSANRIHNTGDDCAQLTQSFEVQAGAALDVWPEYLIPQAGARYRQRTTLRVEKGGTLVWIEMVAPGRVARGEVFAFAELRLSTDVFHDGEHIARERYHLTPAAMKPLQAQFSAGYYASILCISPELPSDATDLRSLAEQLPPREAWLGATQIRPGAWSIKVTAPDSPTLRRAVSMARAALFSAMRSVPANLRRTTGEATQRDAQIGTRVAGIETRVTRTDAAVAGVAGAVAETET